MSEIANKVVWRGFLRRHKRIPSARLLLDIGGASPGRTRERINEQYDRNGDEETLFVLTQALEQLSEIYKDTSPTVMKPDLTDWTTLKGGGHMRKTHKGSH